MNKPNPLFEYLKLRRETVAYVEELKKEAQRTKCAVGQTKNPFKAVPGLETEFEKAVKTIRYCDNILNEIEKTESGSSASAERRTSSKKPSSHWWHWSCVSG